MRSKLPLLKTNLFNDLSHKYQAYLSAIITNEMRLKRIIRLNRYYFIYFLIFSEKNLHFLFAKHL